MTLVVKTINLETFNMPQRTVKQVCSTLGFSGDFNTSMFIIYVPSFHLENPDNCVAARVRLLARDGPPASF